MKKKRFKINRCLIYSKYYFSDAPVVNITVDGDIKTIDDKNDRIFAIQHNSNISIYCGHKAHPSEIVVSWFYIVCLIQFHKTSAYIFK